MVSATAVSGGKATAWPDDSTYIRAFAVKDLKSTAFSYIYHEQIIVTNFLPNVKLQSKSFVKKKHSSVPSMLFQL